jgi:hypothetical protein
MKIAFSIRNKPIERKSSYSPALIRNFNFFFCCDIVIQDDLFIIACEANIGIRKASVIFFARFLIDGYIFVRLGIVDINGVGIA